MAKWLTNEESDAVGELYRRIASVESYCYDLERRLANFDAPLPISRVDPATYLNPYEGQRAIDPADEQHMWYSNGKWRKAGGRFVGIVFGSNIPVAAGDDAGAWFLVIPQDLNGKVLTHAHAAVYTVSSSGGLLIQVRNVTDSVDMLSTRIGIDSGEHTSYTGATPPVINTANDDVTTGDIIVVDVDSAGTGTLGLDIILGFQ